MKKGFAWIEIIFAVFFLVIIIPGVFQTFCNHSPKTKEFPIRDTIVANNRDTLIIYNDKTVTELVKRSYAEINFSTLQCTTIVVGGKRYIIYYKEKK